MIGEQPKGNEVETLPSAHDSYHDRLNNIVFQARGAELVEHDVETNTLRTVKLPVFREATGKCLPEIPRFEVNG